MKAALVLLVAVLLSLAVSTPASAQATNQPDDVLTEIGIDNGSDTETGSPEDGVTSTIANAVGAQLAEWVMRSANQMFMRAFKFIVTETSPVVNGSREEGDWFSVQYQMMMNIGWWLMLPLLFITIIHSIIKGSMQLLLRSFALYLPLAVLGTVVATQIIQLLIDVVDDMCMIFVDMTEDDMDAFIVGLNNSFAYSNLAFMLEIVLGLAMVIIAAFLLIMFLLRDSSIYLAVMLLPLGFAMMVWPMAARYFRKMVEFLVGIILSKLVMIVIVSLSVAAMAAASGGTTAGEEILYPDGSVEMPDPKGPSGAAPENEDGEVTGEQSDAGIAQHLGYVFPALVMLLLAAVSPPMTVRLVGNMGLQEMAGQVADSVENQGWLYQYIGMDRMTKVWIKNPVNINRLRKEGKQIKKDKANTSRKDEGLAAMAFQRNAKDEKYGDSYFIDQVQMKEKFGFATVADGGTVSLDDMQRTLNLLSSDNADDIALGLEAVRQGVQFAGYRTAHDGSTVIDRTDGSTVIVLSVEERSTGRQYGYQDAAAIRPLLFTELERQRQDGGVKGVQITAPFQMVTGASGREQLASESGRVAYTRTQAHKDKKAFDKIMTQAKRQYQTDGVVLNGRAGGLPTMEDFVNQANDGKWTSVNQSGVPAGR